MTPRHDPPKIPTAGENPKARELFAKQRGKELAECQEKLNALLAEYDAVIAVTEIRRFPGGQVQVMHQLEIVSK